VQLAPARAHLDDHVLDRGDQIDGVDREVSPGAPGRATGPGDDRALPGEGDDLGVGAAPVDAHRHGHSRTNGHRRTLPCSTEEQRRPSLRP